MLRKLTMTEAVYIEEVLHLTLHDEEVRKIIRDRIGSIGMQVIEIARPAFAQEYGIIIEEEPTETEQVRRANAAPTTQGE